jgi:hypothetical protein
MITKINWLMLFKEIIALFTVITVLKQHMQNTALLIKTSGAYNYHKALNC